MSNGLLHRRDLMMQVGGGGGRLAYTFVVYKDAGYANRGIDIYINNTLLINKPVNFSSMSFAGERQYGDFDIEVVDAAYSCWGVRVKNTMYDGAIEYNSGDLIAIPWGSEAVEIEKTLTRDIDFDLVGRKYTIIFKAPNSSTRQCQVFLNNFELYPEVLFPNNTSTNTYINGDFEFVRVSASMDYFGIKAKTPFICDGVTYNIGERLNVPWSAYGQTITKEIQIITE